MYLLMVLKVGLCRSREGAWIEIANYNLGEGVTAGRSREGAWIEILNLVMLSA